LGFVGTGSWDQVTDRGKSSVRLTKPKNEMDAVSVHVARRAKQNPWLIVASVLLLLLGVTFWKVWQSKSELSVIFEWK
jgi:hypothetical protein